MRAPSCGGCPDEGEVWRPDRGAAGWTRLLRDALPGAVRRARVLRVRGASAEASTVEQRSLRRREWRVGVRRGAGV